MKKVFLILILFALVCMLGGCNTYSAKKFNNNLVFNEVLSAKEKESLIKEIEAKWLGFSKVTIKTETKYESNAAYSKQTSQQVFKAYKNSLVSADCTLKVDDYSDGVKLKNTKNYQINIWDMAEANTVLSSNNMNGDTAYTAISIYTVADKADAYKKVYLEVLDRIETITGSLNSLTAYKTKSGYVLMDSTKNENYTGVAWGNETKERYNLNQEQIIYVVNKDYEIEKVVYYNEIITNRDPDTNEWYSNSRKISSVSIEVKVKYGETKENADLISALNSAYKESLKA